MGNQNTPKVSVILPSLNVAPYIFECLESVTSQTLRDIEIICVDGGSTDGTTEIIRQYAKEDSRISMIHSEIKSYGVQMNLGIRAAKGEYIGIVETDDYIADSMYEILYSYAEKNKADFIKGGFTSFLEFRNERVCMPCFLDKRESLFEKCIPLKENRKMGIYDPIHIWSGIYRRDFLVENELWFHETPGASFQDTSFFVLVGLVADTCIFIDDCSYHYRIDNMGSSVKSNWKVNCVIDEFKYIYTYLSSHGDVLPDARELIEKFRLITYMWNYDRLPASGKLEFTEAIADEMKAYLPGGRWACTLDERERHAVRMLTDMEYALCEGETRDAADEAHRKLMAAIKSGKRFVVVGAGKYFGQVLFIQKLVKKDFVEAVCDNNKALQGTVLHGYHVVSVEEAAKENRRCGWLVANRYHSEEIVRQLEKAGISGDEICVINRLVTGQRLLELANLVMG